MYIGEFYTVEEAIESVNDDSNVEAGGGVLLCGIKNCHVFRKTANLQVVIMGNASDRAVAKTCTALLHIKCNKAVFSYFEVVRPILIILPIHPK